MKVASIHCTGGKSGVRFDDLPAPEMSDQDLLVSVRATALNRVDIDSFKAASAERPIPIGREFSGEVVKLGSHVHGFAVGDRVMGRCGVGCAELTTIDHRLAAHVPTALSWEEAAGVPVAYMTAHDALITNGRLRRGESVLIHAATSGVGVAAVHVAAWAQARPVLGTGRSASKLEQMHKYGLDRSFLVDGFAEKALAETDGRGVDVIVDLLGGPYLSENLRCAALDARVISVGRLAGKDASLDMDSLSFRRHRVIGVSFRHRSFDDLAAVLRGFSRDILPALASGAIRPIVDSTFPLEGASRALERMSSSEGIGKVVIRVQ